MSDNMNLVAHEETHEKGLTKMQIRLPISTRAGMAELSKRLGISQLALVRSAWQPSWSPTRHRWFHWSPPR